MYNEFCMKTMTCRQLGGACDMAFHAETFEKMSELSRKHAMEMTQNGDMDHIQAMEAMREKMADPNAMQDWMNKKRQEFDVLP